MVKRKSKVVPELEPAENGDLPNIPRPRFREKDLEVPADVAGMHSHQLGNLYSRYSALCAYVNQHLGRLEVEKLKAKYVHKQAYDEALAKLAGDDPKEQASSRKARASAQPSVLKLSKKLSEIEQAVAEARSTLQGYSSIAAALSREFSRRETEARQTGVR